MREVTYYVPGVVREGIFFLRKGGEILRWFLSIEEQREPHAS